MGETIKTSVKDFSYTPGPRNKREGDFSAELFLETILEPIFKRMDADKDLKLEINLNGTLGYGTSFLEEIFGGTARNRGVDFVRNRIEITSNEEPWLKDEIKGYVDDVEKHT